MSVRQLKKKSELGLISGETMRGTALFHTLGKGENSFILSDTLSFHSAVALTSESLGDEWRILGGLGIGNGLV